MLLYDFAILFKGDILYRVNLRICLLQMPQNRLDLWQSIEPRPKFTHLFAQNTDGVAAPVSGAEQYLIIANKSADFNPRELKQKIGESGVLVIYANGADELGAADYEAADEIWPAANEALDRFRFIKILEKIERAKEAWLQKTWLQAMMNSVPDMIWFKDMNGAHLEVNDAFCEAVNKPKSDVRGKDHYYIWDIPQEVYEKSDYVCVQTEDDVVRAGKTLLLDEEVLKADGNLTKLKTYKTPIYDGDTIIGTVGVARDVTKEYEYLQKIEHLARHDQLTWLANRNALDEFLAKIKTERMTIAYFDLDFFKQVNDESGHQAGDLALKKLSALIKEIFPDALNVRIGGDEFISIFTDGSNMSNIPVRTQNLIDKFAATCALDERFKNLSVSVGIAEGKIGHGSFDLLLHRADDALYRAKNGGRGKFCVNSKEA